MMSKLLEKHYALKAAFKDLQIIKEAFKITGIAWVEPDKNVTVNDIISKKAGNHRGLYWLDPERNFYFGTSDSLTATIIQRFCTHYMKLKVDLRALYGGDGVSSKKEAGDKFPEGWKEGVSHVYLEGRPTIPSHYISVNEGGEPTYRKNHKWTNGKGVKVIPGVLDFPVTYKVDVNKLPVYIWNLNHLTPEQIRNLEKCIIRMLEPYCNKETYRKRTKMQKKVDIS